MGQGAGGIRELRTGFDVGRCRRVGERRVGGRRLKGEGVGW